MTLTAQAAVPTEKASRYMKALINHFNRRVTASYEGEHGTVQFGIGNCEMDATPTTLNIHVQADDSENLERVKEVIASHLVKFTNDEPVEIVWVDQN